MIHPVPGDSRPPETGTFLAFALSIAVHIAIGTAMVLAVEKRQPEEDPVVQAELWSSLPPMQPATPAELPPPKPTVSSSQEPIEALTQGPTLAAQAAPTEADIALEKKRLEQERASKAQQDAQAREERERIAREKQIQEKAARDKASKERAEKEKAELTEAARQAVIAREEAARDLKRRQQEERLAKKRAEDEKRQREAAIKKEIDRQRREQEELVLKQFGNDAKARSADDGKDRTTKAGVSGGAKIGDRSGVIASYVAAIRAHVRDNIRGFDPSRAPNNPEVIFDVVQQSNGLISSITMKQSSGNTAWDTTVERAIRASSPLPRASDGSVEPLLTLSFRPQDPR